MPQYIEVNGQTIEFPDGMAAGDIETAIKKNSLSLPAAVSAGKSINRGLSDIPRQIGLTARYGIEGLANAGQVFTEPVAGLMRAGGIKTKSLGEAATGLADAIGLPSPQNANERVIGDAARLVAGAGGFGSAAGVGSALSGITGRVMAGLAAKPTTQLLSAAGAGLAGGASREADGNAALQAGASLIGGIAGGMTPMIGQNLAGAARRALTPSMTPAQIDVQLTSIMGKAGADYSQLPDNVQRSLRSELKSSLQSGKELDPQAIRRLADFTTVGVTPTRGMVSQNPIQITREMNLAKMAANSNDEALHGLPLLQNRNNTALIGRLNDVGGRSEIDSLQAGRLIGDRITASRLAMQQTEKKAWDAAKSSPGYTQPIYPDGLNAMNRALGDEGQMGFMAKPITEYMSAFQTGQQPFTPQHYKNLRSMLSGELAKGGNEAAAARTAITALDSAPMQPLTQTGRDIGSAPVTSAMASKLRGIDEQPSNAIAAINQARAATAAKYRYEESSPLVKTALSGSRSSDPEKLAQSFVLNGTLKDAQSVAREVGPDGVATIRDALATHIKKQALGGASDEIGKVSQSALNSTLKKIGNEKLALFFSPEEIQSLQATGRTASYMQAQPVGSAVNNSNSGALVLGRGADVLGLMASKLPLGQQLFSDPLRNINVSLSQRQAQNIRPGLLLEQQKTGLLSPFLLPSAAAAGGLLSQ